MSVLIGRRGRPDAGRTDPGRAGSGRAGRGRADPAPSRMAYRWQRLRLSPFWRRRLVRAAPLLVVLLGLAAWGLTGPRWQAGREVAAEIRREVEARPEFQVTGMAIDGAEPALAKAIRRATPVDFPTSSFDLDLPAMRAAIESLDAVERARLAVRDGGILEVEVAARVPAAIWRDGRDLTLLDEGGHKVAPLARRSDRDDLPLLAGPEADRATAEALALLAASGPLRDRIWGLERVGARRWDLILEGGRRVHLPETDALAAMGWLTRADTDHGLLGRRIVAVDLRVPARPTVRLAPAPDPDDTDTQAGIWP